MRCSGSLELTVCLCVDECVGSSGTLWASQSRARAAMSQDVDIGQQAPFFGTGKTDTAVLLRKDTKEVAWFGTNATARYGGP